MSINWKQNVTAVLIAGALTAVSTTALAEHVGSGVQKASTTATPAEHVGSGLQQTDPGVAPAEHVGSGVVSNTATSLWDWILFEIGI